MATGEQAIQTSVVMGRHDLKGMKTGDFNILTRTVAEIDPLSGRCCVTVYREDGHGNGSSLFQFMLD